MGCSYREALPPHREQPHSHDGEQINVALEGRFAFTVGDHTEPLTDGWAALTPRGVRHTGLHLELPYFQLIFATPPRGQDYAEFPRSIYRFDAVDEKGTRARLVPVEIQSLHGRASDADGARSGREGRDRDWRQ